MGDTLDFNKKVISLIKKKSEEESNKLFEGTLEKENVSKRKKKKLLRMTIADLKKTSGLAEYVEVWDPASPDPLSLLYLKAYRNSVPVPHHWSQKRKFLEGKRGIEKLTFKLPTFIEATGITLLRDAYYNKEDGKKMKQKGRERLGPKLNKLEINYEFLRDTFFKCQTKPRMTKMGEIYYEGKEFETTPYNLQPG